MRVERAQNNQARDLQSQQEVAKLHQQWIKLKQQANTTGGDVSRLDDLRWLIEELRVSLFAQELRTPMPVSIKRIEKWVEQWGR
jgi:ATP-dependent helicase HrpA